MSSVNNKGTQYDPLGSSSADSPKLEPNSGNGPQSPKSTPNTIGEITAEGKDAVDSIGVSSDDEPPILPPRVSITPRSGLKSRSTRYRTRQRYLGAIDNRELPPMNTERISGSMGTISLSETKQPSENTGQASAHTDKTSPNSGKLSKVIVKHTRKDQDAAPAARTAEYRSKLSEEDRLVRVKITSQNSHPECLKPATAAGLTRRLTLGNYLPNLSSAQFIVRNEVNFWPSVKGGMKGIGRSGERVTYARHAVRGTGAHSARLRTDEERRRSNVTPRLPPARKGAIVTNRVLLVSRSSNRYVPRVSDPVIRPASNPARLHRHETSAPSSAKLAKLQRCFVSRADLSKPIEQVAEINRGRPRPPPPPSDASVPTPSECKEASGKVRAWIRHRAGASI